MKQSEPVKKTDKVQSTLSLYYYEIVKRQLAHWGSLTLEGRRQAIEEAAIQRGNFSRAVHSEPWQFGTLTGEWSIPHRQNSQGIILYLHGGAFVNGNSVTHRAIGSHLAEYSGCRVLVLNYHLSPEAVFPQALEDVVMSLRHLSQSQAGAKVALCGDSAGANLALTAALYLREKNHELPCALGLLCPWTDLTMSCASHQTNAHLDPYFPNSDRLHACAKLYAGTKTITDPLISPLFADLTGLPPILSHIGSFEAFYDETFALHQKAIDSGVAAQIETFPAMWHVWQHFVGLMPEATTSIQKMAQFLKEHLDASPKAS